MFNEETVFILGAGASWHYGYPTGEDLVSRVQERASYLAHTWHHNHRAFLQSSVPPKYFSVLNLNIFEACNQFISECESIKDRLKQVNPIVIDYFLHHNADLQNIGKLLISHVILECEQQYKMKDGNANHILNKRNSPSFDDQNEYDKVDVTKHKDNWCRFVIDKIIGACGLPGDLCKNNVCFITFNYDVSLEYQIGRAINAISFFTSEDRENFFSNANLVIHPYGRIRTNAFEEKSFGNFPDFHLNRPIEYNHAVKALDQAWDAAQKIKTIPESKSAGHEMLEMAKKKIESAKNVYILGYGFDENNNHLLGLPNLLRHKKSNVRKKVFFINYKDSNRINKRAGHLFVGDRAAFINNSIKSHLQLTHGWYYEKSVKNVYEALDSDFD